MGHLPKNKRGNIDWKNTIGCKCKFKYRHIEGSLEIKGYKKKGSRVIFSYNGKIYETQSGRFRNLEFKNIFGIRTPEFRLKPGSEIKDEKRNLLILDKFYMEYSNGDRYKSYKYKCKICGYEGNMTEYALLNKKHSCACCVGKAVKKGVNDIATTHPYMVIYFKNIEDAYNHSHSSNKIVSFKCPDCGHIKNKVICDVMAKGKLACICQDTRSYPEKFMFNVLKQLNLEFKQQYSPKWANNKRYDFYIPKYKIIIETHGEQHYTEGDQFWGTLKEEQENDKLKESLALQNGSIETYIQLDCRKSNVEYIKNSIRKSKLINYIDIDSINWFEVNEFANKNIIKYVCEEYTKYSGIMMMKDIAKEINVSSSTLHKYLKIGNELGFCVYKNKSKKPIKIIETGEVFESAVQCAKTYKELHGIDFNAKTISYILKDKNRTYHGFHFRFLEEDEYAS